MERLIARRGPREVLAFMTVGGVLLIALTVLRSGPAGYLAAPLFLVVLALFANPRIEISLAVLALYLGLLDGYLKLSSGSSNVTLIRDVLIFAIAAGCLVRLALTTARPRMPPLTGHVLAFVLVVLICAANPQIRYASTALNGMRQHLDFVPLFFFGYAAIRSARALRWAAGILMILAVANATVSVVQFNLSPDGLASWGPGYADEVLGRGAFEGAARVFEGNNGKARVRPPGLGSDLGAGGTIGFLALAAMLTLAAAAINARWRVAGVIGSAAAVVAIATSQSRIAIICGVLAICWLAILLARTRAGLRSAFALLLGVGVVAIAVSALSSSNASSLERARTVAPGRIVSTAVDSRGSSLAIGLDLASEHPLGVGIGRVGPASGRAREGPGLNAENQFNMLIGEVGVPGMLIMLSLWIRLALRGARAARRASTSEERLLLSGLVAPLLAAFAWWLGATATLTVPLAPYFWVIAGVIAYWSTPREAPYLVPRTLPSPGHRPSTTSDARPISRGATISSVVR